MVVQKPRYAIDQVAELGTELYEKKIRALVEAENIDRFLAIDVVTGDFAVADARFQAAKPLMDKNPDAEIWFIKIGHVAGASFGGGDTRER